jgi:glycerol-3-phosphate cytidylyltransferase-like family protein
VDEIQKSKTVSIPKSLTRLQVLTKCRNVSEVVQR